MPATLINMALVLLGGGLGLAFKNFISGRLMSILTHALGLCVLGVGIGNLIGTQDMLCVIVCMALGAALGNALDIERRLEEAGGQVDYIASHQAPTNVDSCFTGKVCEVTALTAFMDQLQQHCQFEKWFFGAYHQDRVVPPKYHGLFEKVEAASKRERK